MIIYNAVGVQNDPLHAFFQTLGLCILACEKKSVAAYCITLLVVILLIP